MRSAMALDGKPFSDASVTLFPPYSCSQCGRLSRHLDALSHGVELQGLADGHDHPGERECLASAHDPIDE
jgi:hypothetical protein